MTKMKCVVVNAVAFVLMVQVLGAEENSLLAELGPDSPWIVDSVASGHVEGAMRRARLTGTPFAMSRAAADGQTEYRVFDGNVVALETVITHLRENGLFFREVTDGRKVIKLLYSGRRGLVECDVQKNRLDVDDFVAEFLDKESSYVGHLRHVGDAIDVSSILNDARNATAYVVEPEDVLDEPYAALVNMKQLLTDCSKLHRLTRRRMLDSGVPVSGRRGAVTEEGGQVTRESGRRRVKRTKRGATKGRSKRGLMVPDTKWCGAGSENANFEDVGHSRATDRCCREHDHCPYYIGAMSKKYNLFNARLYTISHCYCDEVFRTCLKDANTDQSAMVGRVYFNLLGMKCFEFETEEVCVERSWWGWCQKTEEQLVAKVRGSLNWP